MSNVEKEKFSYTGSVSSNREKSHSHRGNGGKRSRHYSVIPETEILIQEMKTVPERPLPR